MDDAVVGALRYQRAGVEHASLASPLYAVLLDATLADIEVGGPCARVLAAAPPGVEPIVDALTLRYLGALHRIVLDGRAPALARWYPSAGGTFDPAADGPAVVADYLAAVEDHAPELVDGLALGVQTNEVGRCATLAVGFTAVLRTFRLPLRLLEIGASAGLNLRWDRWNYRSGPTSWGDPDAPLRFEASYRDPVPDVSAPVGPADAVLERQGCDRSPIDPTTEVGCLLLRSFVWPDQQARHARLDTALAMAAEVPATVEQADAADWLARRLADPAPGVATVVYHSIVWQYLPVTTRERIIEVLRSAGAEATTDAPLAWLRMEPGTDLAEAAEVRLRTWPGEGRLLARSGYHGFPVWRVGPGDPTPG